MVIVPFPYSDRYAEKRRPALVVSGSRLHEAGLLWILMITTAKGGVLPYDVPIEDPAAAGLSSPCVVRTTKIACIEPARLLRVAGRLGSDADRAFALARRFIAEPGGADPAPPIT